MKAIPLSFALLALLAGMIALWVSRAFETKPVSSRPQSLATAEEISSDVPDLAPDLEELDWPWEHNSSVYTFDSLSTGDSSLISKSFAKSAEEILDPNERADLWLQENDGNQRWIAGAVTWARFSPDGSRIAYLTTNREMLIETLSGNSLARIPNVADPHWSVDSSTLTFLAVPSSDYPELRQEVVYDIASGRIIQSQAKNLRGVE